MSSTIGDLSCFVICPIGDRHALIDSAMREIWEQNVQTWEEIIAPACAGVGLAAVRADQINEVGDITDQIFRRLRDAHVVIADLTGANPNVMYELGLRHTTGKLTIQIGEVGRLPFDVATIRTIQFKRTPAGLVDARRALVQALAAGIGGAFTPISATRIWLETANESFAQEAAVATSVEQPEEAEQAGYLEIQAERETASSEMMASLKASGNVLAEIAAGITWANEQLASVGGVGASIEQKIAVSDQLAQRIDDPITRLEALTKSFADSVKRADPGTKLLIEQTQSRLGDNAIRQGRTTMTSLFSALLQGLRAGKNYRDSVAKIGSPTRAQGRQNARIVKAIDIQSEGIPTIEGWLELLQDQIEKGEDRKG